METIGEKIKFIRQSTGLSQAEFGENMGFSKQAVSNVENNLSKPSIDFINKLILHYNINSNWLIAGFGEPYNKNNSANLREDIINEINKILIKSGI